MAGQTIDPKRLRELMRRKAAPASESMAPPPQAVAAPKAEPVIKAPVQPPAQEKPAPVAPPKEEKAAPVAPAQAALTAGSLKTAPVTIVRQKQPEPPPKESLKTAPVTIVPPKAVAPEKAEEKAAPAAPQKVEKLPETAPAPAPAAPNAVPLIPDLDLSGVIGAPPAVKFAPVAAAPDLPDVIPQAGGPGVKAPPADLSARLAAAIGDVDPQAQEDTREIQIPPAIAATGAAAEKYVAEHPPAAVAAAAKSTPAKQPKAPGKAGEWAKSHAFGLTLGGFTVAYSVVSNVLVPEVGQIVNGSGLPQALKPYLYPVIIPCVMAALTVWSFFAGKGKNITKGSGAATEAKG